MKKITEISIFAMLVALSMVVCGCGTTKKVTEKQKEYYSEETQEMAIGQTGVGERLDRKTVMEWFSEWSALHQSQTLQQDTEEIRETVTTTTDSTGAVTRIEIRTTNRASATQTSQESVDYGRESQLRIDSLTREIETLQQRVETLSNVRDYGYAESKEEKKPFPVAYKVLFVAWIAGSAVFLGAYLYKKHQKS